MNKNIRSIQEEIFAVIVIFFTLVMVYSALEISRAATNANVNVTQTIGTGTLSMTAENTQVNFNDLVAGQNVDSLMNMNNIMVTDTRGTNAGWSVTIPTQPAFISFDDTNHQITLTDSMKWSPGEVANLNGADSNGVTPGSDDVYLSEQRTLMIASVGNGAGEYRINNTVLKFEQEPADNAGNYRTNMVLTVS
ncbi:WxL domain-containing protein [Patescibacteria group bacterium]|nr:WxL domain-containing protein [Patescibacteria group bacterium]MBU1890890.1 WxL domain-containing protein [Patescibacteria group bacterium]